MRTKNPVITWGWMATLAALGLLTCQAVQSLSVAADQAKPAVTLVIDYGDGVQKHFRGLAWTEGATVLDAIEAARRHPRGIQVEIRGQNATAFLLRIDDCRNQGRGKNWVYRINGRLADKSLAVQPIQAGDTITWEFGEYRQP